MSKIMKNSSTTHVFIFSLMHLYHKKHKHNNDSRNPMHRNHFVYISASDQNDIMK